MSEVFRFFGNMWSIILSVLDLYSFDIGGVSFSLFDILLGFILASMAITIFWKGARG